MKAVVVNKGRVVVGGRRERSTKRVDFSEEHDTRYIEKERVIDI